MADIELTDGADENGLALMMATLIRQNLEDHPDREADLAKMHGRIAIIAFDAEIALTLECRVERVRLRLLPPTIGIDQFADRQPTLPTALLQLRLAAEVADIPHTEIRDRDHRVWQGQDAAQILGANNGHPPHAYFLGPRGQPQVLHCTHRTVDIHLALMCTAQYDVAASLPVTGNAQVHRRVQDAL